MATKKQAATRAKFTPAAKSKNTRTKVGRATSPVAGQVPKVAADMAPKAAALTRVPRSYEVDADGCGRWPVIREGPTCLSGMCPLPFERMRLVRDDVANRVEDLRKPCARSDCTAADIESARRCNAASVRAHSLR